MKVKPFDVITEVECYNSKTPSLQGVRVTAKFQLAGRLGSGALVPGVITVGAAEGMAGAG